MTPAPKNTRTPSNISLTKTKVIKMRSRSLWTSTSTTTPHLKPHSHNKGLMLTTYTFCLGKVNSKTILRSNLCKIILIHPLSGHRDKDREFKTICLSRCLISSHYRIKCVLHHRSSQTSSKSTTPDSHLS